MDPSEDPALFASLQSVIGSKINYKLAEDIDNLILILDAVIDWGENVEYQFQPTEEHMDAYNETLDGLKNLRTHFNDNKDEISQKREQNKN
ncbi:hypothetical protein [Rhodohalobacter sp. 614A]|uniref:hypothetical protein n=1 Tax=Rhodohalobacter sp. 614A TaxID=2908649 RepID=UPI001F3605D1|nr:hypothetical protein [Rhodohalobacter sp. 614A]